jgi:hypothetical protein
VWYAVLRFFRAPLHTRAGNVLFDVSVGDIKKELIIKSILYVKRLF